MPIVTLRIMVLTMLSIIQVGKTFLWHWIHVYTDVIYKYHNVLLYTVVVYLILVVVHVSVRSEYVAKSALSSTA